MAHKNWEFSYAGISLPPPTRDGIGFQLQPIGHYDRSADGDMLIDIVAMKKKLTVKWGRLNGEQVRLILSTLENNREGVLIYYDASLGRINSIQAYYGAGAQTTYSLYDDDLKKQAYSSLTANFIWV